MVKLLPIPLLIEDVNKINSNYLIGEGYYSIYGQMFRHVMFYGYVSYLKSNKYTIDDGASSIAVIYKLNNKQIELKHEIDQMRTDIKNSILINKKYPPIELPENVTPASSTKLNDITILLEMINRSPIYKYDSIRIGSKVIVYGRPFIKRNTNELLIYASEIYPDDDVNRDYEIFYKRLLIDLYRQIYSKYTIDGKDIK